jgi:hypothetical protein
VLPILSEPVRHAAALDADLPTLIASVKAQAFEGLVAKRRNSVYEPGRRAGAWQKARVNRGQEFVIGGYTRGTNTSSWSGLLKASDCGIERQITAGADAAGALPARRILRGGLNDQCRRSRSLPPAWREAPVRALWVRSGSC